MTISFDKDGISGASGCNSYSGLARDLDLLPCLIRYGMYGDSLSMQTNDDVFLLFQAK